jgi:hypothetical protein
VGLVLRSQVAEGQEVLALNCQGSEDVNFGHLRDVTMSADVRANDVCVRQHSDEKGEHAEETKRAPPVSARLILPTPISRDYSLVPPFVCSPE